MMPLPTDSSPHSNGVTSGELDRTPNRTANTGCERVQPDSVNFGLFNEQVQKQVHDLQAGWSTVDGAIAELTRVFVKYEKIVGVVSDRRSKDTALETEIHDLKIKNEGIWEHIKTDREAHQKEMSVTNRKHEEELADLQTQADAGAREKKTYEKMQRRLADQHEKEREDMERDLQRKRVQLEQENSAKIAALEKQKGDLETAQARLERELSEKTSERDQEKDARETMQREANTKIGTLEKILHEINAQYHMENRPSHF